MVNKHFKSRISLLTQAHIQMKTFIKCRMPVTTKPKDSYSSIQPANKTCTNHFKWPVNKNLSVLVSFMRPLMESPVLWTMWHGAWQPSEPDDHSHIIRKKMSPVNLRKLCKLLSVIWNESAVWQTSWSIPCLNMRLNSPEPAGSSAQLSQLCNFSKATAFSST